MPNMAASLILFSPFSFLYSAGDRPCSIVLITAHDFKGSVRIIGNIIETDHFVGHWDGKQMLCDLLPIVHWLVIEISPMEIVVVIELAVRTGVSEIKRLIRIHRYKDLNERKQPGEHTFVGIFLDLLNCLGYRDAI